jgi:hypothetical protein
MSWWDEFRESLADSAADADRRASAEVARFIQEASASGATTDEERQAVFDKWLASLPPEQRADIIEAIERQRTQLEAMLIDSGFKGNLDDMTAAELASLAASRGLLVLSGDGDMPTDSALAAAAAAVDAGGSWTLDPVSGDITIYRDADLTVVHDVIPGGQEGPPAEIVSAEVMGDSDRGGARPTREQFQEAARIQANNPESGLGFGEDGSLEVTRTDGTVFVIPNNPLAQGREDLEASAGDLRSIGEALDGAATRGIDSVIDGITGVLGGARVNIGGGSASAGMGGTGQAGTTPTGTGPASNTTSNKAPSHSGYNPAYTATNTHDSSLEPEDFGTQTHGTKPASTSTNTTGSTTGEPAKSEPNEIVDRSDGDEPVQPDNDDGYRPSTTPPPTDSTYVDTDKDGIPDEEEEAEEEEEDPPATDTEYTPTPDGENRQLTQEDFDRMAELAAAREGWRDGTAVRPAEYDPAFAARLQDQKLGMIGNPGDPDQDMGPVDGELPETRPGEFDGPDDDTGNVGGHDLGREDRMLDEPQGTLDPSILDDQTAPPLAPQEMVTAHVDPGATAPLEEMVAAEFSVGGTPEIHDYMQALGDPVSSAPEPEEEPDSLIALVDPRIGSKASIPDSLHVASRDALEDDSDAG